jgi:hypothetical protein
LKAIFRLPGAEYAYAQIETSEGNPFDVAREVRDMDDNFWNAVGNALAQGCSLVALGVLQPQVVNEPPVWDDGASAPQWASQGPQDTQGYSAPAQTYQAPQNGYQAPQGGYAQNAPTNPPGMQAPICQQHGQPAKYKPAGTNKTTGRPYNAFWTCPTGDFDCTKASNFPRI